MDAPKQSSTAAPTNAHADASADDADDAHEAADNSVDADDAHDKHGWMDECVL